jgi:GT2 family glycosyltransferase
MNRARWRNRAAAGAWDVAVFADADIMVSMPEQVTLAVATAERTGHLTYAHDWRAQLSQQGTTEVLQGGDPCRADIEAWDPHTFSGCYAVPRRLWDAVGGFDERFAGWGWEDLAFMRACGALGGGLQRAPGVIYHCWHPQEHDDGGGNVELWQRYDRAGWAPHKMRQVIAR